MFNRINNYFKRKSAEPSNTGVPTLVDADLGELRFMQGIGWIGVVFVDGIKVDIAIYSSGDRPNQAQKEGVQYWITNWFSRREELVRFMTLHSEQWNATRLPMDWQSKGVPDFASLELSAIVQSDPFVSAKTTIYLAIPGDDCRQFVIQLENCAPYDFGFDDG